MGYPSINMAATEAAIAGHAVLFSAPHEGIFFVGLVWWDGDKRFMRALRWS